MREFPVKHPDEERIYTAGLQADQAPGAQFTGTATVTVSVYDQSDVTDSDANLAAMKTGSASINIAAAEIEGETVGVGRAISQKIKGGIAGAKYIVQFKCALDNGETYVEDFILPLKKYVP